MITHTVEFRYRQIFRLLRHERCNMIERDLSRDRIFIMMVDDDPDDFLLVRSALASTHFLIDLFLLSNGKDAMDYLLRRGSYREPEPAPRPDLILLDLKMPQMGGIETLRQIKSHPDLARIPIAMLTSSTNRRDIAESYKHGAALFLLKPHTFDEMIQVMNSLCEYWFDVVQLPEKRVSHTVG